MPTHNPMFSGDLPRAAFVGTVCAGSACAPPVDVLPARRWLALSADRTSADCTSADCTSADRTPAAARRRAVAAEFHRSRSYPD